MKEKVCDSDAITFEQATDEGVEEANINAGSKITSGSSAASVGYRAKRNGVNGTVINKRGMKTFATSGKIVSTNASWTINGVTFTNLTSATYNSDSGDSGGVVYSYISSTGARLTLGIHKGRKDGNAHYVKANQINRSLGTSRY